jgi:hypothetical protein
MVLLCDGRLVCGCADPYGRRVLGDTRTTSVSAVWTGETASALRKDLNAGGSKFCGDCPLKLPLKKDQEPPQRDLTVAALPSRLYIETTAACNISCEQACCAPETGISRTRQAGPSLGRIDFFNYGEAFLHKRAVEMCEYIKSRFPHIYLYTSTNGLAFSEDQVRRLIRSGIDEVTFSIDGARADSYVKYRRRGDFDKALRNLRFAVDEKRSSGRDVPFINWRYILFKHNDSDEEMRLARETAAAIGVDRLCWELGTDGSSRGSLLAPFPAGDGRPGAHPSRNLGRQQPRQRHSGRDAARRNRGARAAAASGTADSGAPRPARHPAREGAQHLHPPIPGAGHLRPPPGSPRGSALRG